MEDPPSEALHASRPCPHPGAKVTQAGSSCVTPRSKWSPVTGPAGQRPPRSGQGCRGTQWAERPSEGSEHEAARTPPPRSLAPSHQSPASQPQGAQLPPGTLLLPPLTGKLHQGSRGVWETGSCRDQSFLCEDHPCCLPLPSPLHTQGMRLVPQESWSPRSSQGLLCSGGKRQVARGLGFPVVKET